MKKLYLSAAAAITALSLNAQIYVVGNGNGMSWDLPGMEVAPAADGSYTFNVTVCDQLKISTNNSTQWDGDGSFNAGAFAPDNESHGFSNAVFNPGGETLNTVSWGDNISLPAMGRYTITVNAECTKITAEANFAKPTTAPNVYIRGDMNGWGANDQWKFTNISYDSDNNTGTWEIDCTIMTGQNFKIADSSWGNINYTFTGTFGYDRPLTLAFNQSANMSLSENFTGKITFKITGPQKATATFTKSSDAPSFPENLYVIGTINGNAWDPSNTALMENQGDGIYSIASVTLGDYGGSAGFAITGGGSSWDEVNALRFGPTVQDSRITVGEEFSDISLGDLSWSIAPGKYSITFDMAEMTILVENAGGDTPVDPTPGDTYTTLYVVGAGEGLGWDLPGKAISGTGNVFTFTVNGLSKFKASVMEASPGDWDAYNAGSYNAGPEFFDAARVYPNGQTLPIVNWGEDQLLPFEGNYTITYDFNSMTMTVKALEPQSKEAPAVYLRGDMNNWLNDGLSDTYKFTNVSWDSENNTGEFTWTGEIGAGLKFKIADGSWGTVNYGYGLEITADDFDEVLNLEYNGDDMVLTEDFKGTLKFNITGASFATAEFASGNSSAVEAIEAAAGEARYYDLQGRRVADPDRGLYIRVQNGKATKVVK